MERNGRQIIYGPPTVKVKASCSFEFLHRKVNKYTCYFHPWTPEVSKTFNFQLGLGQTKNSWDKRKLNSLSLQVLSIMSSLLLWMYYWIWIILFITHSTALDLCLIILSWKKYFFSISIREVMLVQHLLPG